MGKVIVDSLTIEIDKDHQLTLEQECMCGSASDGEVQHIVIDKEEATTLRDTIEIHFELIGARELYERALSALIADDAPHYSPNGNVGEMDSANEKSFSTSPHFRVIAYTFNKTGAQVAADVIAQACEPRDV